VCDHRNPVGQWFGPDADAYQPRAPRRFRPQKIVLTRGSMTRPERRAMAEAICAVYPEAEIEHRPEIPHNRIPFSGSDPLAVHCQGKKTLVLGEHKSAVRMSSEQGNACPNYWHFSPYGFCPHGCHYCYLAGTQGVRFSPTVKIFVNLPEILGEIDRTARRIGEPTAFYVGKLQDGLALDPLTGYSRTLIRFFADHPYARMTLLTKSDEVDNLLGLDHRGHTILSWTLGPPEVRDAFEPDTPTVNERIAAMKRCAEAGYPVRAVVMPIIPISNWPDAYTLFLDGLLSAAPLQRITLGSICIYRAALTLMERKIGPSNPISNALRANPDRGADGRLRFAIGLRVRLYRHLIEVIRGRRPDLTIGLCLEERSVFEALNMAGAVGCCNCVL